MSNNTIDRTKVKNTKSKPDNIKSVEGAYTKIPNNLKVHRETYILNLHGDDSSKKCLLSLDGLDDDQAIEIPVGFLSVNDFTYADDQWFIKSKDGTGEVNVVVIQSKDDGFPKRN